MSKSTTDPAMVKVLALWQRKQSKGMTLGELGNAMGYPDGAQATQAAWQFLRGRDPRISSLRRFAKAVGVTMAYLVRE